MLDFSAQIESLTLAPVKVSTTLQSALNKLPLFSVPSRKMCAVNDDKKNIKLPELDCLFVENLSIAAGATQLQQEWKNGD